VSVGHLARLLEAEGIATVVIAIQAFRPLLEAMTLPRVLVTPHLLGRPVGAAGDRERQQATVLAALTLLSSAGQAGTVRDWQAVP